MSQGQALKRALRRAKHWIIHPQWLAYRSEHPTRALVQREASGRVLDIGCADSWIRSSLLPGCEYLGLDYPTTGLGWYKTRADVHADAHQLPFGDASLDTVLLLDVIEHLSHPSQCLAEITRVLRPGGKLVLKVPFLYPLHDAPRDFHRWTEFGLRQDLATAGLAVRGCTPVGIALETAALLTNIAMVRTCLDWWSRGSPLVVIAPVLAVAMPFVNIIGWLGSITSEQSGFMPHSILVTAVRTDANGQ